MNQAARIIIGIFIALVAFGVTRSAFHALAPEPKIPPITSEHYLKLIDQRIPDNPTIHCIYKSLLNKYGVNEVMRLDALGLSDPENEDLQTKFTEAAKECEQ